MPVDKIDNSKFFLNAPSQPVKPEEAKKAAAPAVQNEEKSNATKYMLGATALAIAVAAGVIGHKNNWWRGAKNITPNGHTEVKPQPQTPVNKPETPAVKPENTSATESSIPAVTPVSGGKTINTPKQSKWGKVKDTMASPFRRIKERREAKRLAKEAAEQAEQDARYKEWVEMRKQSDAGLRQSRANARQEVIADTPNRLARIAEKEKEYPERVQRFWKKDFGDIDTEHVVEDYEYARVKPYLTTNPECFVPAPKKGEYDLRHFAVDGYWNGPGGLGASNHIFVPGTELRYDQQFTLHDPSYRQMSSDLSDKQLKDIHWAMQKVALKGPYDTDKRYHIGTALRFSAPEYAADRSRPLGWNIFIEGDIPLEKMKEIKKQLVESGIWAKHMAIQNNDTMIEVFNEIIRCLNR
ncbi:hypothetical protein IKP85_01030 [bacterium]|nr:hypothetical protein [bacterium]